VGTSLWQRRHKRRCTHARVDAGCSTENKRRSVGNHLPSHISRFIPLQSTTGNVSRGWSTITLPVPPARSISFPARTRRVAMGREQERTSHGVESYLSSSPPKHVNQTARHHPDVAHDEVRRLFYCRWRCPSSWRWTGLGGVQCASHRGGLFNHALIPC
jgi:hypothetical protein